MNKRNHKKIFYDGGIRWIKIKKLFVGLTTIAIAVICIQIYAFYYSPFEKTKSEGLYEKIEEINNNARPAINQGTFLSVEDVYGKTYVKKFGEEKRQVILTFDDGPHPVYTPEILKILEKEKIKGTFYVLGEQIYKYPEIGKDILNQGSDMGLHTFSHWDNPDDKRLSKRGFIKEMDLTQKIFAHEYGYKTNLFRIPFLSVDEKLSYNSLQYIREAKERGLVISAPTVDSTDWNTKDVKVITKYSTTSDVRTVVLLLHDAGGDRSATVKALPQIIKFYKSRGSMF